MRILVLNWKDPGHPHAGGAERFVREITEHWAGWGHDVTVFTAKSSGLTSEETINGVRIVRDGGRGRMAVFRRGKEFLRAESRNYDVVVDSINTRPFLAPWHADVPVVGLAFQVCRDVWFDEFPVPLAAVGRYILEPWWLRQYRQVPVITISESSRESLAMYGLENVRVVPVGIDDVPTHRPPKEAEPTVLFVGRLAANKRPGDAIRAFRLVREQLPNARLWIIGGGPVEAALKADAPEGVTFLGKVSDAEKFDLMARAHVLVATSRREGWGLVVTEAAAMGTPAVCYDVPGLRDSVAATGAGCLTAANPEALAAGLTEQLRGEPRRVDVPPWTWADVAKGCLAVLDDAVAENVSVHGGKRIDRTT